MYVWKHGYAEGFRSAIERLCDRGVDNSSAQACTEQELSAQTFNGETPLGSNALSFKCFWGQYERRLPLVCALRPAWYAVRYGTPWCWAQGPEHKLMPHGPNYILAAGACSGLSNMVRTPQLQTSTGTHRSSRVAKQQPK